MSFLSGCSSTIRADYSPSLKPTLITLPPEPTDRDYQMAIATCVIERKVLYKDLLRNERTLESINRKWFEVWK